LKENIIMSIWFFIYCLFYEGRGCQLTGSIMYQ
jgi:hypothetical protein